MTPKRRDVGSLPEPEDDHKRMRDLISENNRLESERQQLHQMWQKQNLAFAKVEAELYQAHKTVSNLTGKNIDLEQALRHACLKIQLSVHQVKDARKETSYWANRMLAKLDREN